MATMTPSSITLGQIGKLQEIVGAGLRKSGFSSDSVQLILETQGDALVDEVVAAVRKRVEAVSEMIVRHVRVDRSRTPQQLLDATGRRQHVDPDVVANMPGRGNGIEEKDLYFFPIRRFASDEEVDEAFKLHGLKRAAGPYEVAQANTDDPGFADKHPNATYWKDASGKWCYLAFSRWGGERLVFVLRGGFVWDDSWWCAGLRE